MPDDINDKIAGIVTTTPTPTHSWDDCEDENCVEHYKEWQEYEEEEAGEEGEPNPYLSAVNTIKPELGFAQLQPIEPEGGGGTAKWVAGIAVAVFVVVGVWVLLAPQKPKWVKVPLIVTDALSSAQCGSLKYARFPVAAGVALAAEPSQIFKITGPCMGINFSSRGGTVLSLKLEGRKSPKHQWIELTQFVNPESGNSFAGPAAPEMRLVCTGYIAGPVYWEVYEEEGR